MTQTVVPTLVFDRAEDRGATAAAAPDLVTAMNREGACIARSLRGQAPSVRPNLWAVGVGAQAGPRWAASLPGRPAPSMLISMGFAGGLVDSLRPGDIVLSEGLLCEEEPLAIYGDLSGDLSLVELASQVCQQAGMTCRVGDVLTVAEPVCSSASKLRLGQRTGAIACCMEDYWLAKEASRAGIPFLSARVILDPANQDLPPIVVRLAQGGGVASVVRSPGCWLGLPRLVNLARQASLAQRRLGSFAASFCSQLPVAARGQVIPGGEVAH